MRYGLSKDFRQNEDKLVEGENNSAPTPEREFRQDQDGLAERDDGPPSTLQQDAPVPWYLQVERPKQELDESHPLEQRQRIPDLPHNPPPILPELLQHISVELGLDDLNLLDLRHLDPPPALGSKLLMIIGSARSEKHLHVSADRFCRWLRSTHKLKPHAAGLMGRNELKLKLRRKAKRMKMMANVGASETGVGLDDGIRTGWVCVTVGRVEAPEAEKADEQIEEAQDGFIGFGRRTDGINIVVQMLTEEKREDIDLEGLWGGVLKRAAKEKASLEELKVEIEEAPAISFLKETPRDALGPLPTRRQPPRDALDLPPTRTKSKFTGTPFSRVQKSQSGQQLRRLHTVGLNLQSTALGFPFIATGTSHC